MIYICILLHNAQATDKQAASNYREQQANQHEQRERERIKKKLIQFEGENHTMHAFGVVEGSARV